MSCPVVVSVLEQVEITSDDLFLDRRGSSCSRDVLTSVSQFEGVLLWIKHVASGCLHFLPVVIVQFQTRNRSDVVGNRHRLHELVIGCTVEFVDSTVKAGSTLWLLAGNGIFLDDSGRAALFLISRIDVSSGDRNGLTSVLQFKRQLGRVQNIASRGFFFQCVVATELEVL